MKTISLQGNFKNFENYRKVHCFVKIMQISMRLNIFGSFDFVLCTHCCVLLGLKITRMKFFNEIIDLLFETPVFPQKKTNRRISRQSRFQFCYWTLSGL